MARKLTVVAADTPAKPKQPETVRQAADQSERSLLVALRSRIAAEVDRGVPAHALAPLCRQLRDLARDINAIDARANQEASEDGLVPDEEWDASTL